MDFKKRKRSLCCNKRYYKVIDEAKEFPRDDEEQIPGNTKEWHGGYA
ncbi:hypothetical protein B188_19310 [Candidatus Brocadiaceae bacterium B188]|nr:hypothetical protein [Candidatus Brocadia sapporoensis]MBW7899545.1 hypothetical protein [Candidatus Brocadia sapporoensis]QQR66956.1 MAG: hypothetical protein IPI25_01490 [Candidatus Brocadia sp.]TWU53946.1 hypothetical protein B188_19310 [Candidatus Brocadiaceae bacterium B188]